MSFLAFWSSISNSSILVFYMAKVSYLNLKWKTEVADFYLSL